MSVSSRRCCLRVHAIGTGPRSSLSSLPSIASNFSISTKTDVRFLVFHLAFLCWTLETHPDVSFDFLRLEPVQNSSKSRPDGGQLILEKPASYRFFSALEASMREIWSLGLVLDKTLVWGTMEARAGRHVFALFHLGNERFSKAVSVGGLRHGQRRL